MISLALCVLKCLWNEKLLFHGISVLVLFFDDVLSVCAATGCDYALGGGSVLGAVRHRGFIPWDDDLDLNMPRADWPRFRRAFVEKYGDKYAIPTW